jgi:hypothetical protein
LLTIKYYIVASEAMDREKTYPLGAEILMIRESSGSLP